MSLDKVLTKMLYKNPALKGQKFDQAAKDVYYQYARLHKAATFVDKVDLLAGPVEELCKYIGTPELLTARTVLRVGEGLLLKLPFAVYYAAKTKDLTGVALFAGVEAAAACLPYGDFIKVHPTYRRRTEKFMSKQILKTMAKR